MNIRDFSQWLNEQLNLSEFSSSDASMNGMQVSRRSREISRLALAVDACAEVFQRSADQDADALLVHHGLFWGKPVAVTGGHYQRLSLLLHHDIALFAAHLPLDAHPEVGNNAAIAAALGLKDTEPFGEYHGHMIGCRGNLPRPMTVSEILEQLEWDQEDDVCVLPFGPDRHTSVGIISGGAAKSVQDAIDAGLDLFITGENSHQVYHDCLETGITMIAGGHYRTEVYGLQKLAERIEAETDITTVFVDVPTGL